MEQRAESGVQIMEPNVQTARIIASSLAGGVMMFWVVSWVMTAGGAEGISPEALPSDLAFWIWGAAAVAVYLLGVIVTFPRAEWFGGDSGRGAP